MGVLAKPPAKVAFLDLINYRVKFYMVQNA